MIPRCMGCILSVDRGNALSQTPSRWGPSRHWILSQQEHGILTCLGNPVKSHPQLVFSSGHTFIIIANPLPIVRSVPLALHYKLFHEPHLVSFIVLLSVYLKHQMTPSSAVSLSSFLHVHKLILMGQRFSKSGPHLRISWEFIKNADPPRSHFLN